MNINLRPIHKTDWIEVAEIYSQGIATGFATFETKVPSWETWSSNHHSSCSFVAEVLKIIIGFASLAPVSKREVYSGVAESSVYVAPLHQRSGVGKLLMNHLISESEKHGFWTLQASIFRENKDSIQLHSKCGFREIGYRERVAKRNGKWYDNILMERRSPKIN